MDALPWVTPVYKRDLTIEKYFGGYLKHPYISFYTGRGCKSRCTFCLWPQTVGGHRYRVRSVEDVVAEMKWAKNAFPQVKEFFFDDDTLTDNLPRVEALAKELGKLGVTWSCNAKANVPRKTLEVMKDNGLRLLLVGYESGNQQILFNIKKGMRVEFARRFTKDCHELGIVIHGTFILGLPGRDAGDDPARRWISPRRSIPTRFRCRSPPPIPGTFLYRQAKENGWLYNEEIDLLTQEGTQIAPLNYPHLSHTRDLRVGRGLLQEVLFPPVQDRVHRGRDDRQSRNDEAPSCARAWSSSTSCGRGGTPLEATDRHGGRFRRGARSQRGRRSGASRRHSHRGEPHGRARRRRPMPSRARGACLRCASGCTWCWWKAGRCCPPPPCLISWTATAFFVPTWRRSGRVIALSRAARRELAAEITAQFAAFRDSGLTLDHCNAHKHFHLHPLVGRADRRDRRLASACAQCACRASPRACCARSSGMPAGRLLATLTMPFALVLRRPTDALPASSRPITSSDCSGPGK